VSPVNLTATQLYTLGYVFGLAIALGWVGFAWDILRLKRKKGWRKHLTLAGLILWAVVGPFFTYIYFSWALPGARAMHLFHQERWEELSKVRRPDWRVAMLAAYAQYEANRPDLLADTISVCIENRWLRKIWQVFYLSDLYTQIETDATRAMTTCQALTRIRQTQYYVRWLFADWAREHGAVGLEDQLAREAWSELKAGHKPVALKDIVCCAALLQIDDKTSAAIELIAEAREEFTTASLLLKAADDLMHRRRVQVKRENQYYPEIIEQRLRDRRQLPEEDSDSSETEKVTDTLEKTGTGV